jgi:hypothetical protein
MVEFGCGMGPKHLSEAEFNSGKAAMEDLDRAAISQTRREADAWSKACDEHMSGLRDLPLIRALVNYSVSISERNIARLDQIEANRRIEKAATHAELEKAFDALHRARANEAEWGVTIKACRDDVAQWFVTDAPATHVCETGIAPVRKRLEDRAKHDQ